MKTCLRQIALLAALACAGCGPSPTEIFVAIDSELSVPDEIDNLLVFATGPSGDILDASGDLTDEPLPRTVGIVHETEGPLGPVTVLVQGARGTGLIVERSATLSFVEDRIVVLPMYLLRRCAGMTCGPGSTCDESGGCRANDVDESSLSEWDGTIPRLTPCEPRAETCNGSDEDCDGRIDETFDLMSDVDNCGSCGNACRGGNAVCCSGICGRTSCP